MTTQTVFDDPDLMHLLQLLDMLPGPQENRQFWADVHGRMRHQHRGEHHEVHYVFQKMATIWQVIQKPSVQNVNQLAKYVMVFFSSEDPELWDVLTSVTNWPNMSPSDAGRRWAADACDTAWRLHLRYRHEAGRAVESLTGKWRYEESWRGDLEAGYLKLLG